MDSIDKGFYNSSMKEYKKYSNEKLIMEALHTLLDDTNQLKATVASSYRNSSITEALKDELQIRVQKDK